MLPELFLTLQAGERSTHRLLIVMCDEGYQSSLAAASLQLLAMPMRRISSEAFKRGGRQGFRWRGTPPGRPE
jgi:rhodanese-related sulfurtransferase